MSNEPAGGLAAAPGRNREGGPGPPRRRGSRAEEPRGVIVNRNWTGTTVALLVAPVLICAAAVRAQPPSAAPWKKIYESNQATYYVDAAGFQKTGGPAVASLVQYKIPRVI